MPGTGRPVTFRNVKFGNRGLLHGDYRARTLELTQSS
jgi:hypothetical protein